MVYIVKKCHPRYRQMSIEEFLFGDPEPRMISTMQSCTRTYVVHDINAKMRCSLDVEHLISVLEDFCRMTSRLREADRHSLYRTFFIPKRSGGLRKIDAPNDDLMLSLRNLKGIFENEFGALYHTSAFAYIKGRCPVDAIKRHQQNESKWFAHFDFSNFFGSTDSEFVFRMLSMIYPFSEVVKSERGAAALKNSLELCFLDGVLPQGTPISPLLTNIMMIPVDYKLFNTLRQKGIVYTRYADDIIVSSKYSFDFHAIENEINNALLIHKAPFRIKPEKTRYGSSAGSNYNLGVILNKDNIISVGAKRKRELKASLTSYILDNKSGNKWNLEDVMVLNGIISYYKSVEEETITGIINKIGQKFGVDIMNMIACDMKN